MKRMTLALALIIHLHFCLKAQGPDAIAGLWITPENKAIVQIAKHNGSYTGKILRIHPRLYINGLAPKDTENVHEYLRSRSLEGITTLTDITFNSKEESWQIRKVYDPERGKYYEGFIVLAGSDRLKLRGHVPGKKWLGETQIWQRQEDISFPESDPESR
jgi:uncharacterized protein (DUF2147 family)